MKLEEFVSETLKEIITGVKKAQLFAGDNGARINPNQEYRDVSHVHGERMVPVQDVEFDVAVTSDEKAEVQAGAGVLVAGLGLGTKGRSNTSSASVNRIRFSVPVVLPVQENRPPT